MGLSINLNSAALTAHRNVAASGNAASKSIEKLSSGYKINNAADDPAGLVISEKLRAQISGLGQAISNAGDATNMIKTAEGAMNETATLLRSMRSLALHAANTGANDSAAIAADQSQIRSAIASLNSISSETQFGNKKLLDGSAGINTTATGAAVNAANLSNSGITANAHIGVNVTTAAAKATLSSAAFTVGDGTDIFKASDTSFTINGVQINTVATDTVDDVINKINNVSAQTGVTALNNAGTKKIDLSSTGYGTSSRIDVTSGADFLTAAATSASAIGVNAAATITNITAGGNLSDASWTSGDGLTLEDSLGNTIVLTQAAGTAVSDKGDSITAEVGTLQFQVGAYDGQTRTVSISSSAANKLGTTAVSGEDVSTIDVTTAQGAQDAIKILDDAIAQISTQRAALGAFQKNVLDSTVNSLTAAKENITASESTIRDTDMAEEMTNFTKNNILQQAGISMLSQANQAPQQLLSLLR